MGVDYRGNYGIGLLITVPDLIGEFEDYGRLEYIEEILEDNEDFFCFEVGSEMYGGDDNEIYICIDDPFSDGLDITNKVIDLKQFLFNNSLEYIGEVDVVGGLLID